MKIALRVLLLLAVFAGVGIVSYRVVLARGAQQTAAEQAGAYLPETRLAAMMAGLFAGGAATVLTGISLAVSARGPQA